MTLMTFILPDLKREAILQPVRGWLLLQALAVLLGETTKG
jgi:hypothetical protein